MTTNQDTEDYQSLILNGVPLLDVRAPIEFSTGHLPTSYNISILSDDERVAIGTCYKREGRNKAVELGHQLVSGDNRTDKMTAWQDFYQQNPNAVIYCARGGMRSKLTQQWLKDAGINLQRVHLGYKGLRTYLLSVIESANHPLLVVSGNTGSGKTELLHEFDAMIDLEGLANHHGSAFGKNITPQPAQATFENALAVEFVKKAKYPFWLIEDESRCIGKVHLPESLHKQMAESPLVIVEESLESRLSRISHLYFLEMSEKYRIMYGDDMGWEKYTEYLIKGLSAVQKRLGGVRYTALQANLEIALDHQLKTGNIDKHYAWLSPLLTEYYDPMYEYQLEKKKERVIFRDSYQNVRAFLDERMQKT